MRCLAILVALSSCEGFLRIERDPMLNNAIRGIELDMQEAFREELSRTYRGVSCVDTNTNLTKFLDGVLVSFIDIHICGLETKELVDFETIFEYGGMHFKYIFDQIYLKSKFQVRIAQSQTQDTFDGFRIVLEDVLVEGSAGLAMESDHLWRASAWSQEVKPREIYIEGYHGHPERVNLSQEAFNENSLGRYLRYESFRIIERQIKDDINDALRIIPPTEVLSHNATLLRMYRSQLLSLNDIANTLVDHVLQEARDYVTENHHEITAIPNYETKFTRRWGVITLWGDLRARGGSLRDLSTVKRTANFTVLPMKKTKMVKIFGALGLSQLNFGYEHYEARVWNIGPTGRIEAEAGDNSIAFYLKGKFDTMTNIFDVKRFMINIVDFENVQIKATGLGPFNWLYSIMLSRIAEDAKDELLPIIEGEIEDNLSKTISEGLCLSGFQTFLKRNEL